MVFSDYYSYILWGEGEDDLEIFGILVLLFLLGSRRK